MKIPKRVDKFIRGINKDLPAQQYQAVERVRLKGSDLKDLGVKEVEGKPIDLMGSYTRTGGRNHQVNHSRRMRKAYKKGGALALTNYIKQFVKPTDHAGLKADTHKVCTA